MWMHSSLRRVHLRRDWRQKNIFARRIPPHCDNNCLWRLHIWHPTHSFSSSPGRRRIFLSSTISFPHNCEYTNGYLPQHCLCMPWGWTTNRLFRWSCPWWPSRPEHWLAIWILYRSHFDLSHLHYLHLWAPKGSRRRVPVHILHVPTHQDRDRLDRMYASQHIPRDVLICVLCTR